ncbi:MAG: class I SAM-dependent methyltransferase [Firmicutes bacterium]|jgi:tRNA (adenine22-N1)-methyltransferase|nr:class I SAM-dependent methyltransferase [Bacillota bacterium]
MKLTKRLEVIADLVDRNAVLADIGSDHGYLPVYLVEKKIINRAIASDVNQGPVDNAISTVKQYKMENEVEVRLGSGLNTLSMDDKIDTVVIAGMGGNLISQLLEDEKELARSVKKLILQPMTTKIELRKYLLNNGYTIVEEKIAIEGEKIYEIIVAEVGEGELWDEVYYDIGKRFDTQSEEYATFISEKLKKYKNIVSKIESKGGDSSKEKLEKVKNDIRVIEEIISHID